MNPPNTRLTPAFLVEPRHIDAEEATWYCDPEPALPRILPHHEQRQAPRLRLTTEVTFESETNFFLGLTENISEGGLFIATEAPCRLGSELELTFELPDGGPPITARAVVRWLRTEESFQDMPPGMGVQFEGLEVVERARIGAFIRQREAIYFDCEG